MCTRTRMCTRAQDMPPCVSVRRSGWLARALIAFGALLLPLLLRGAAAADSSQAVSLTYAAARAQIGRHLNDTDVAHLPCAEPRLHGFVEKRGTMLDSATIRVAPKDVHKYAHDGAPIYAPCQVLVNHKHRFIYIRTPKSASSAILRAIRTDFCAGGSCPRSEMRYVEQTDPPLSDATWRNYFVFTFVRNPWTRMRSAHRFLTTRHLFIRPEKGSTEPGPACGADFETFARDAYSLRSACTAEDGCCAFLPKQNRFVPSFVDVHLNDQAHCAFLSDGAPLVDFIGRSEHAEEDWATVVAEVARRLGRGITAHSVDHANRMGEIGSPCDAADGGGFSNSSVRAIAKQFSREALLFGFV